MKKLLSGLAALPFLASVAFAAQPMPLTDNQMDKVTAGGGAVLQVFWIPCVEFSPPPCTPIFLPCVPLLPPAIPGFSPEI
jgi:hypothetical protein